MKYSHYFKSVAHLDHIDVYRVLDLFGVTDSALGHAAKKILCAGVRGAKNQAKDVQEAIDTLTRWQEMQAENHIRDAAEKVSQPVDFGGHVDISQLRWEAGKEFPLSAMAHKTNETTNRPFVDIPECKTRETKHDLWTDDKELPSSGIYSDQGYTDQDLRSVADLTAHTADTRNSPVGGALVHDADAVDDGWIEHVSDGCPLSDESMVVEVRNRIDKTIDSGHAEEFEWGYGWRKAHGDLIISHWRYGKDQ